MPLPVDLPIIDHHCHLSATGDGVEAARRFARAGGTHLFLATQTYGEGPPRSVEQYREQFEETERLARRVEEETGITVYCVVAPHPVDLVTLTPSVGLGEAIRIEEGALELAGRWVEEQRAVAIGEIGRPHFPVPTEIAEAAEGLFVHALEVARDAGSPALVHSEDLEADGYRSLAGIAARAGFPVHRLVKHYARSLVPAAARYGLVPSFLAERSLVRDSLADPGPWFWETDYLDDPRRPGAVLDLATVPRRAKALAGAGDAAVEALRIPFESAVRSVYGFTPVVPERRGA